MKSIAIFSLIFAALGLFAISTPKAMASDNWGNNWNRGFNNDCFSTCNQDNFRFRRFKNNDNFRFRDCDNHRFKDGENRFRRDHNRTGHNFRFWR